MVASLCKALFLDRDGVINRDIGYAYRPDQIVFMDGIFDLCRAAYQHGYLLIIVSNQAGIGRGYYKEEDFHALSEWMKARFEEEGAPLHHVYFCPHHPEHGIGEYKQDSFDRKPNPGMILKAQKAYQIDLAASLMIGDKEGDMQAAIHAGIGMPLFYTDASSSRYHVIRNLKDAILFLK